MLILRPWPTGWPDDPPHTRLPTYLQRTSKSFCPSPVFSLFISNLILSSVSINYYLNFHPIFYSCPKFYISTTPNFLLLFSFSYRVFAIVSVRDSIWILSSVKIVYLGNPFGVWGRISSKEMSFQDLESGRAIGSRRDYSNGKQDPTQAVASGIFQINTAVSTFHRLVNTLGTPKDTPELREKLWVLSRFASIYLFIFLVKVDWVFQLWCRWYEIFFWCFLFHLF